MSHVIGPADETDRARWAELRRRVARSYRGHPSERQVRLNLRRYIWLEIVPPGAMADGEVVGYQAGRRHFSRMTSETLKRLVEMPVPPTPAPRPSPE